MDIAAMASVAKHAGLQQQVSLAVAKLAMEQLQTQASDSVRLMQQSVNPSVGSTIDLYL